MTSSLILAAALSLAAGCGPKGSDRETGAPYGGADSAEARTDTTIIRTAIPDTDLQKQ
jgi:hypothetical protein